MTDDVEAVARAMSVADLIPGTVSSLPFENYTSLAKAAVAALTARGWQPGIKPPPTTPPVDYPREPGEMGGMIANGRVIVALT